MGRKLQFGAPNVSWVDWLGHGTLGLVGGEGSVFTSSTNDIGTRDNLDFNKIQSVHQYHLGFCALKAMANHALLRFVLELSYELPRHPLDRHHPSGSTSDYSISFIS